MEAADEEALRAELRASQAAMPQAEAITTRRRKAVAAARKAKMSKYAISAELGVSASTVESIIKAAIRNGDLEE